MTHTLALTALLLALPAALHAAKEPKPSKPNVIIILTDDQGYGDIGAHGHPFLKTPNMDKLHAESIRFTDFHVAPMCSPTRGQLMTGVDAMKNGATAVCQGRSMVREDIPMLPNYFADAGYATGIFGKWHLGDSYPHRPQDRGFQEVLSFRAWGLPSLASNWENSDANPDGRGDAYSDPMLEHNGVDTIYPGYSGDIWFTEAMKYMAARQQKNEPFFVYLPNNLAHTPSYVSGKYSKPYADIGKWKEKGIDAKYYGMIANIDENMGRLDEFLVKNRLKENTIVLYFSDNGSRSKEAAEIWNGGMRGIKTELWDGGHRVPCFFRWPQSGIKHGRDIHELTEVQDIAPTLLELCGIKPANLYPMDGVSWGSLLRNEAWPHADRKLTVQYRVSGAPWNSAVVQSEKWRLLQGNYLFNVANDPHQDKNVAGQFPDTLKAMSTYYDEWHKEAAAQFQKPRYIHLGNTGVPAVILYASDWQGDFCDTAGSLLAGKSKGSWDIAVETTGDYQVELSRWPFESGKTLTEGVTRDPSIVRGTLPVARAQLIIADCNQTIDTKPEDKVATFTINLKAGKTKLTANLLDKDGTILCGAFYVKVTRR
jgi:arylsulfatase